VSDDPRQQAVVHLTGVDESSCRQQLGPWNRVKEKEDDPTRVTTMLTE
jgi:hypothetical protein